MPKINALVAAAGRGSRAGLPYPKTLFSVKGKPILIRLMDLLRPYDKTPTIVVSPDGQSMIQDALMQHGMTANTVVQSMPRGMGDAVLCFEQSPAFKASEHVLLVWGDIPFIQPDTVQAMVDAHFEHKSDFTFVTRRVDAAYTVVSRDLAGKVLGVIETREAGIAEPQAGERDIGLFLFRKNIVFDELKKENPNQWGKRTGEHGFLYVIGRLAELGYDVQALPIATPLDLVSLNSLDDLSLYL